MAMTRCKEDDRTNEYHTSSLFSFIFSFKSTESASDSKEFWEDEREILPSGLLSLDNRRVVDGLAMEDFWGVDI